MEEIWHQSRLFQTGTGCRGWRRKDWPWLWISCHLHGQWSLIFLTTSCLRLSTSPRQRWISGSYVIFFSPLMLILRCFLTFSDLCVGCAVGDLHHQEPQGRPGFLLLLPSDGWISWGSRNVRWVHGKILGRQRWEVMTKPVAAFISVRWRPCCLQCCLENGPITWRAGDTQILETE